MVLCRGATDRPRMGRSSPYVDRAEGMFSHAWAGSVVETYNSLLNLVNRLSVPPTARFFFCTFCLYQPQDSAAGSLSISDQIAKEPFRRIIESQPAHGMWVMHTSISVSSQGLELWSFATSAPERLLKDQRSSPRGDI